MQQEIKPKKRERLSYKNGWNGKKVVQLSYEGNYSMDEIKDYVNKFNQDRHKEGFKGELEAVLQYNLGKKGWRTMGFRPIGEQVQFYDEYENIDVDEPESFKAFKIILMKD